MQKTSQFSGKLVNKPLDNFGLNRLLATNIRGLNPKTNQAKVPYLRDLMLRNNIFAAMIVETHLSKEIKDSEIKIDSFSIFRSDRPTKNGGTCIYVLKSISTKVINIYAENSCESIFVKLLDYNIILAAVYKPPSTSNDHFHLLIKNTRNVIDNNNECHFLIFGDFNLPNMKWYASENSNIYTIDSSTTSNRHQAEYLVEFMERYFLDQMITEPTREENYLDLMFSSDKSLIHESNVDIVTNKITDHNLIMFHTRIIKKQPRVSNQFNDKLNFFDKNIDWNRVRFEINNISWEIKLKEHHDPLSLFYDEIKKIIHENIPLKRVKVMNIPKDRKILMRKRQKLKENMNSINKNSFVNKISKLDEEILQSHYKERLNEEKAAISNIKTNPKFFYGYAKKYSKTESLFGPLVQKDAIINAPEEISNVLNRQFCSVWTDPIKENVIEDANEFFTTPISNNTDQVLQDMQITEEMFITAINELKANSSPGPDNISAKFLKECKHEISKPIKIVWQIIFDSQRIPNILKESVITPIHKSGCKSKPENYRPISLTSIIMKLFEKVVRDVITRHLSKNNYFNFNQHGFRQGRSTISQLLHHYENLLEMQVNNYEVDVIYLDFAKAFDKVDHGTLLHKVKRYGITGKLGCFIHEFLTNRIQYVSVNGVRSEGRVIKSGVPQGTVLGPILFLIMISDIDKTCNPRSLISSFADDTKLSHQINNSSSATDLQNDLNLIYKWASENGMKFNSEKFTHLSYGDGNTSERNRVYFNPDNEVITKRQATKDLGIIMQNNLKFNDQIRLITAKARSMCGWILRTFRSRDKEAMITLYKTLVRPILDYGSQLWNPNKKSEIKEIENVQKYFTKKIKHLDHKNYWERLQYLKLMSLERRRERYIILYIYKIISEEVPNFSKKIILQYHCRRGRHLRHQMSLSESRQVRTLENNFMSIKGIQLFNSLPVALRNFNGPTNQFKFLLDQYLWTVTDQPISNGYNQQATSNTITEQKKFTDC